jgi:hypothetical protein
MQITFYILIGIFALYSLVTNFILCWSVFKLSKVHYTFIKLEAILNHGTVINESLSGLKKKVYIASAKSLFIRVVIVSVLVYFVSKMG